MAVRSSLDREHYHLDSWNWGESDEDPEGGEETELHEGCFAGVYRGAHCRQRDGCPTTDPSGMEIFVSHFKCTCALCFVGLNMTMDIAHEALPPLPPELQAKLVHVDTDWTSHFHILHPEPSDSAANAASSSSKWILSEEHDAKYSQIDPQNPPKDIYDLMPEINIRGFIIHADCFRLLKEAWDTQLSHKSGNNLRIEDLIGRYLCNEVFIDGYMPYGSWGCRMHNGLHLHSSGQRGVSRTITRPIDDEFIRRVNTQVEIFLQSPYGNEFVQKMIDACKKVSPDNIRDSRLETYNIGELFRKMLNWDKPTQERILAMEGVTLVFEKVMEYLSPDILPTESHQQPEDLPDDSDGHTATPENPMDELKLPSADYVVGFFMAQFETQVELSHIESDYKEQLRNTAIAKLAPQFWKFLSKANMKRRGLLHSFNALVAFALRLEGLVQKCNGEGSLSSVLNKTNGFEGDDPRSGLNAITSGGHSEMWVENYSRYFGGLNFIMSTNPTFDLQDKLVSVFAMVDADELNNIDFTFAHHTKFEGKGPFRDGGKALRGICFTVKTFGGLKRIELGTCVKYDEVALIFATGYFGDYCDYKGPLGFDLISSTNFPGFAELRSLNPNWNEHITTVEVRSDTRKAVAFQALMTNDGYIAALQVIYVTRLSGAIEDIESMIDGTASLAL